MFTQKQYIEEGEKVLLHTYNRYKIVLDRGEGVYLFDLDGKKYLDFALREGLRVDAIVVSDTQPIDNIVVEKIPVYHLSEVPFLPEECTFINAGEREVSIKVIANNIRYAGYYKVLNG